MENTKFKVYIEEKTQDYGRIFIEPLERGYGDTLGNALRRLLLSSIRGAAVIAVRIDGILHEFSTIKGIREDVIEILMNLIKNRKLQKWFRENEALLFEENNEFTTPTTLFNVFYILLHIYRHFLYEGVGFRQIIDYYMVLRAVNCTKLDVRYSKEIVSKFGVERFAKGLMWVMRECLGMPCEWMLWEPDEKEGKYILKQVMQGGNFGHYDERLLHKRGKLGAVADILRHNMHLFLHYPADVLWAPVWIVWHKLWKVCVGNKLTVKAYDYRYRTA